MPTDFLRDDPRLAALPDGLHRLRLADGRAVVIKRRRAAAPGFFAAEARGLALLRATATLRVPETIAWNEGGIVLADLGHGRPAPADWIDAGRRLAALHAHHGDRFGLEHDGWCGDSAQANTPMDDGWTFFACCRLLPQGRRARDAGRLDAPDLRTLERFCVRLPHLVPGQPPSLLHGDLWLANLHPCADGTLALIDAAAAHHGWAEAELAMLTLFGEPPATFFDAYREASGIDPGWRARAPLYNLYHLLNHLNLFGAGYHDAVRAALART